MAFQLDTNIPLMARSADVTGAMQQGFKTGGMLRQLQQEREEAPIRKQLLQDQAKAVQLSNAQQEQALSVNEMNRQKVSVANASKDLLGFLDRKDYDGGKKYLYQRLEDLKKNEQSGQPDPRKFKDTLEAIQILESEDAGAIQNLGGAARTIVKKVEAEGLLKPQQAAKGSALQQGSGDLAGFVFNPNTGVYSIDPNIKSELDRKANIAANKGEPLTFKDKQGLNKDVTGIIKKTVEVKRSAEELSDLESLGTPAAKLGAVFKFMKALDPTSVVRETEQGQVYAASGAAAQMAGSINSLLGQGKLTAEGFNDLVNTAQTIANSNIESVGSEVSALLDSFGNSIDQGFSNKVKKRIPSKFDIDNDPAKEKRGGVLHVDANGNRAIVYPDGSFEEVN